MKRRKAKSSKSDARHRFGQFIIPKGIRVRGFREIEEDAPGEELGYGSVKLSRGGKRR